MKVTRNSAVILLLLIICGVRIFADTAGNSVSGAAIERYALYVASNRGGEGRDTLKYAGTDAESLAKTMIEIGGVRKQNSFILVDSTREEIEGAFDNITSIIERNKYKAKRVEFLFYYSGHSDEESLLLGDEKYGYFTSCLDSDGVLSAKKYLTMPAEIANIPAGSTLAINVRPSSGILPPPADINEPFSRRL